MEANNNRHLLNDSQIEDIISLISNNQNIKSIKGYYKDTASILFENLKAANGFEGNGTLFGGNTSKSLFVGYISGLVDDNSQIFAGTDFDGLGFVETFNFSAAQTGQKYFGDTLIVAQIINVQGAGFTGTNAKVYGVIVNL